jgi:hypothetical protein
MRCCSAIIICFGIQFPRKLAARPVTENRQVPSDTGIKSLKNLLGLRQ